jgi:hypothetical protein
MDAQAIGTFFIGATSVAELRYGIGSTPIGRHKIILHTVLGRYYSIFLSVFCPSLKVRHGSILNSWQAVPYMEVGTLRIGCA